MTAVPAGTPGAVEPGLDHLVYAAPDLAAALESFELRTGLRPAAGGRHLGLGTRNYLLRLGPTAYLEIIGPDLEHPPAPGVAVPFGVDRVVVPRLLTWAVHPPDLDVAVSRFAAAGADLGAPRAMSRRTPDGALLQWRLATALPLPFGGVVPFLIDWGSTAHPASDPALPEATLVSFSGTHPDPAAVSRVLGSAGLALAVQVGPAALTATLDTPRGLVTLS
jgi:hypothetical protein